MANNIPDWVKVMMLKGDKGDYPVLSEEPIDNGYRITATNPDGTTFSFDVTNATSGDYSGLTNKPSINGFTLYGNKTGSDLGLVPSINGNTLEGNKKGGDLGLVSLAGLKKRTFLADGQDSVPANNSVIISLKNQFVDDSDNILSIRSVAVAVIGVTLYLVQFGIGTQGDIFVEVYNPTSSIVTVSRGSVSASALCLDPAYN